MDNREVEANWTYKPHDEDRKKHDTTQKTKEMSKSTLKKPTGQIQSGQSRDTGNSGCTRHRKKTNNTKSTTYLYATVILFCTRCPPYIRTPTFQLK